MIASRPDGRPSHGELLSAVNHASWCSRPRRLAGEVLDLRTGAVSNELVLRPCGQRDEHACPACARLYAADTWQLVAAGLRGGKGVPASVAEHPRLFATLTAPSFGPVHSTGGHSTGGHSAGGVCSTRPGHCHHGAARGCPSMHGADDPVLGQPLCSHCYSYVSSVLFNAEVGLLWERTVAAMRVQLAAAGGTGRRGFSRLARLSYLKVAEFQRRGVVHLHVVLRADGPDGPNAPPPAWLDRAVLELALRRSVRSVRLSVPGADEPVVLRWGEQLDVALLEGLAVAGYLAKYVTKSLGEAGPFGPVRSAREIERLQLSEHARKLVRTAWQLGGRGELCDLRLRQHAQYFGFRGQVTTKSQHWSTTMCQLRAARAAWRAEQQGERAEPDGHWRYAGRGYLHPGADDLATRLGELLAGWQRRSPGTAEDDLRNRTTS